MTEHTTSPEATVEQRWESILEDHGATETAAKQLVDLASADPELVFGTIPPSKAQERYLANFEYLLRNSQFFQPEEESVDAIVTAIETALEEGRAGKRPGPTAMGGQSGASSSGVAPEIPTPWVGPDSSGGRSHAFASSLEYDESVGDAGDKADSTLDDLVHVLRNAPYPEARARAVGAIATQLVRDSDDWPAEKTYPIEQALSDIAALALESTADPTVQAAALRGLGSVASVLSMQNEELVLPMAKATAETQWAMDVYPLVERLLELAQRDDDSAAVAAGAVGALGGLLRHHGGAMAQEKLPDVVRRTLTEPDALIIDGGPVGIALATEVLGRREDTPEETDT